MFFMIIFVIAVLLWVAVSLVLVSNAQSKKKAASAPDPTDRATHDHTDRTAPEPPHERPHRQTARETAREAVFNHFGASERDEAWREELAGLPGVLGWILLHRDGEVIETSEEVEVGALGNKMSAILGLARQMSEELGVTPPELMEWEGSQGSILVAFPKQPQLHVHLVLFLDTDVYKNQMRDVLAGLNWESDLMQVQQETAAGVHAEPVLEGASEQ